MVPAAGISTAADVANTSLAGGGDAAVHGDVGTRHAAHGGGDYGAGSTAAFHVQKISLVILRNPGSAVQRVAVARWRRRPRPSSANTMASPSMIWPCGVSVARDRSAPNAVCQTPPKRVTYCGSVVGVMPCGGYGRHGYCTYDWSNVQFSGQRNIPVAISRPLARRHVHQPYHADSLPSTHLSSYCAAFQPLPRLAIPIYTLTSMSPNMVLIFAASVSSRGCLG